MSIWVGTKGKLDTIEVADVLKFEAEFLEHLRRNTKILDTLRETNVFDDDTKAALEIEVDKFLVAFQGAGAEGLGHPGSEEFDAVDSQDINQEKIVKRKR